MGKRVFDDETTQMAGEHTLWKFVDKRSGNCYHCQCLLQPAINYERRVQEGVEYTSWEYLIMILLQYSSQSHLNYQIAHKIQITLPLSSSSLSRLEPPLDAQRYSRRITPHFGSKVPACLLSFSLLS